MSELWLSEAADNFWEMAGGFTADFETALLFALPITIERITSLTVRRACNWLGQRGFQLDELSEVDDRSLRACLVAQGEPCNFVLLDANDSLPEQNFSLAHEVAHFLLDYVQPRQQAQTRLSGSILEVLDGKRPPTLQERLDGILAGLTVRPHQHFMERNQQGNLSNQTVLRAEEQADQLALELLAPEELALPLVRAVITGKESYSRRVEAAATGLTERFKLPASVAKNYAMRLTKQAGGQQSFMEWLRE